MTDPSSMQDAGHMNFVIDLAHRGVSVAQGLEHRSAESEGLRFDSSWRLRIVSLSHARDKTKKNLSHIRFVFTCQNFRLSPSLKCAPKPAITSRCPNYFITNSMRKMVADG